jgi:hypothetical protein
MPPGDILARDGEYQFWTELFNGTAVEHDAGFMVSNVDGLYGSPEVRTNDIPRQSEHGVIVQQEFLGARTITLDLAVFGYSKADFEDRLMRMRNLFSPIAPIGEFAWRRNGVDRFVFAKGRRLDLPTEGHGALICEGSAQIIAPDPRMYDVDEQEETATILAGANNVGLTLNNAGTFWTWARIEIDGPVTNPRIANADDSNRQLKIDHVVGSGQLLEIDQANKIVEVDGVDAFNSVRTDNQWIRIQPGDNDLTFSRSGIVGTSVIRTYHRSAWI